MAALDPAEGTLPVECHEANVDRMKPVALRSFVARISPTILLLAPSFGSAQDSGTLVFGAGLSGTYYCILSRCDTGTAMLGFTAYDLTRALSIEGGARWHNCSDCDRFLIGEASFQLRYPGATLAPFLTVGISLTSDPDFLGNKLGLHAAVGTRIWAESQWGARIEIRGRQVGQGDHMGDLSLIVVRRVSLTAPALAPGALRTN